MNYRQSSIDIIRNVVAAMTFPIEVTAVTNPSTDTYVLTTCDIKHAQPGFKWTIDSVIYEITEIDGDEKTITVTGSSPVVPGTWDLYTPFFFHGTVSQTNIDLKEELDAAKKTPLVWMLENFTDEIFDDPEDAKDRIIKLRLFFLTQPGKASEKTDPRYHHCIEPMRRLQENFIAKLRKMPGRFDLREFDYELMNYAKFGVFITEKGMPANYFSSPLSGVEMKFSLTVLKTGACPEC